MLLPTSLVCLSLITAYPPHPLALHARHELPQHHNEVEDAPTQLPPGAF